MASPPPRRAPNAYVLFCKDQEHAADTTFAERGRRNGELWSAADAETKERYIVMADEFRDRQQKTMDEFKREHPEYKFRKRQRLR